MNGRRTPPATPSADTPTAGTAHAGPPSAGPPSAGTDRRDLALLVLASLAAGAAAVGVIAAALQPSRHDLVGAAHDVEYSEVVHRVCREDLKELDDSGVPPARGEVAQAGALSVVVGPVRVPADVIGEETQDRRQIAATECNDTSQMRPRVAVRSFSARGQPPALGHHRYRPVASEIRAMKPAAETSRTPTNPDVSVA